MADYVIFDRPEESTLAPCGRKDRLDQKRRRTLPVGPGNSGDRNPLSGTRLEICTQASQRSPPVRHERPSHTFSSLLGWRVGYDRDR